MKVSSRNLFSAKLNEEFNVSCFQRGFILEWSLNDDFIYHCSLFLLMTKKGRDKINLNLGNILQSRGVDTLDIEKLLKGVEFDAYANH